MVVEALKHRMQRRWRARRMQEFTQRIQLQPRMRIIDLGGLPELWETIDFDLDITLVNTGSQFSKLSRSYRRTYRTLEADACDLGQLADGAFDLVFSNSVIEHVGSPDRQANFARNVRRLASQYWVQTPSIWFPIEAHCNLPLWWFYPPWLQQQWLDRWQRQGKKFKWQQMSHTRVLTLDRLKSLFPGSSVYVESVAGFPKSYSMYVGDK
ncbi:MAG: methyltransferase domain-containing protein [Cyanobacteriota bacterium]|nr:methyltransferase domain-containing protein [Cyanobacteriota bacterium]